MKLWNGISIFSTWGPTIQLASDASGSRGCGAFSGHEWFQVQWTEASVGQDISLKNSCLLCWRSQPGDRGGVATTCTADATMKQLSMCLLHGTPAIMLSCTY